MRADRSVLQVGNVEVRSDSHLAFAILLILFGFRRNLCKTVVEGAYELRRTLRTKAGVGGRIPGIQSYPDHLISISSNI
ncbi:hypothetical protein D9M70_613360 [compost metagenome]